MVARRPSEWPVPFDIMIELMERLRESTGIRPSLEFRWRNGPHASD